MMLDRDLIDKSQDAFVSFIRYYKEHQLTFIFAFNMLEIGEVANSFFLFKIPRVKEILGKQCKGFIPNNEVNIESIPYVDVNKGNQK
jgi:ATP-dependent RNA helicase DDX55/SPB4|tara:strand:+ start:1331 stop:1591 length:261 start_codon:yes stop_codon:yes gene_type:complete